MSTTFYPPNPRLMSVLQSDVDAALLFHGHVAHYQVTPAAAAAAGVHAAVVDTGAPVTVTTGLTSPATPRNITATAGGTAADVKAIAVVITGTDWSDAVLVETLPVFTVNTTGIVVGSKAFKTITSVTIPAHDGTGATTEIGFGSKLGLPALLTFDTVQLAAYASTREATPPTVVADPVNISGNTVQLASALAGGVVDVFFIIG